MTASTAVSVRLCTSTDARDAPSESRTAISCLRRAARARSKAAMFVAAISSNTLTAPNTTNSELRTPPTTLSLSGAK